MRTKYRNLKWFVPLVLACLGPVAAGCSADQGRAVLWSQGVTPEFQRQYIEPLLAAPDPNFAAPLLRMGAPRYFMRLAPIQYVYDTATGEVADGAILGTHGFVFLTLPEAGMGRDLYGIYSDLGYSAEDVLRQKDVHMAAIVFRYEDDVEVDVSDGPFDSEGFENRVIVPKWDKIMDLFSALARHCLIEKAGGIECGTLALSDQQTSMVTYFTPERREQIKNLPYALLRVLGGPDWDYRRLLEAQLGANSHFRGVGITMNTLSPADGRRGVQEYLGPKRRLKDLPEVAIIDVGAVRFVESHD